MNYDTYYQQISKSYDSIRLDSSEDFDYTVSYITERIPRGAHILDIGCGTGRYGEALSLHGYFVTGIDKASSQVEQASVYIHAIKGSATALPFEDASFDACTMIMMVHQLEAEERYKAFSEVHRVLKNGGILIIKTASHDDLVYRISSRYFPGALKTDLNRYPDIDQLACQLDMFTMVQAVPARINIDFCVRDMARKLSQRRTSNLANLTDLEIQEGVKDFCEAYSGVEFASKESHYTFFEARKV